MTIVDLANEPVAIREQAAALLVDAFGTPMGWPNLATAREEVAHIIADGFARGLVEDDLLLGWIGGLPEYGGRVWELHPIVVRREHRRRGIGRALAAAFEAEAAERGALTVTLGADDDAGKTSLSGINLYEDLPHHMRRYVTSARAIHFCFISGWATLSLA